MDKNEDGTSPPSEIIFSTDDDGKVNVDWPFIELHKDSLPFLMVSDKSTTSSEVGYENKVVLNVPNISTRYCELVATILQLYHKFKTDNLDVPERIFKYSAVSDNMVNTLPDSGLKTFIDLLTPSRKLRLMIVLDYLGFADIVDIMFAYLGNIIESKSVPTRFADFLAETRASVRECPRPSLATGLTDAKTADDEEKKLIQLIEEKVAKNYEIRYRLRFLDPREPR